MNKVVPGTTTSSSTTSSKYTVSPTHVNVAKCRTFEDTGD